MRLACFLAFWIVAGAAGQEAKPARLADFARLVGDEWTVTPKSGRLMYHTWHWGPGKHSLRRMTDGSNAGGEPWRAIQVLYWHPGDQQVRLLGLDPFQRGVSVGSIAFAGKTAEASIDLFQTGGRRELVMRWAFDGDDKIAETLLERIGGRLETLVEVGHVRSKPPAEPRPYGVEGEKPSERLKPFHSLIGHTWEAQGKWESGDALQTRTTFQWVPLTDTIHVRVVEPVKEGEPEHLLDAYLYHHTGANALRCLALTATGGVCEGDVKSLDGGGVEIDLKCHEGGKVVRRIVRLDPDQDGTLRQRVWSVMGSERTLRLDVRHRKVEGK